MKRRAIVGLCATACLLPHPGRAQSLADVARRAEQTRPATPSRLYTNADLERPRTTRDPEPGPAPAGPAVGEADRDGGHSPLVKAAEASGRSLPAAHASPIAAPLRWPEPEARPQESRAPGDGGSTGGLGMFELVVNGAPGGEALVLLEGAEVWIERAALDRGAVRYGPARQRFVDGRMYVLASAVSPPLQLKLDERELTLAIRSAPAWGGTKVIDLASRPSDIEHRRDRSMFVNYGLNVRGRDNYDVSTETGISIGSALLLNTFSWSAGRGAVRGPLNVTFDDRRRLNRWVVGDSYVPAGTFGGGVPMAGVGISRNFTLDPYFTRYPSVGLSGVVDSVSTIDVYANDQLVSRQELQPGRFDVNNIPVPLGRGATRVVVRDAFGRQRDLVSNYFLTSSLLAPGLQEFSYFAGFRRMDVARSSWAYGAPVAFGRHRAGITEKLTLGFFGEASASHADGGLSMSRAVRAGELEFEGAISRGPLGSGGAGSFGYAYRGRRFDLGGFARAATSRFTTLATDGAADRQSLSGTAFASVQAGRLGTLTMSQSMVGHVAQPADSRTDVAVSASLGPRGVLSVNASRGRTGGLPTSTLFAAFTLHVGERLMATASYGSGRTGSATGVNIQRGVPVGVGYGYRFQALESAHARFSGAVEYQSAFGRYEMSQDFVNGEATRLISATGGLVGIGGGVFATRPLSESFALVQVPGVRGVRAYAANQEIGRTDRHGNLLVPNLLPYYGNQLSIDDTDVPMDRALGRTNATVAPAYRGGAKVVFVTRPGADIAGSVLLDVGAEAIVPAYGDVVVQLPDGEVRSPIGRDGSFYLENLPTGVHRGTVEYREHDCVLTLNVEPNSPPLVDAGALRCRVQVP